MYERTNSFAKLRLDVGHQIDVHFAEFISLDSAFILRAFGVQLYVLWEQVEYQLFRIYGGDFEKRFGTSGTINEGRLTCKQSGHNACLHRPSHEIPPWCAGWQRTSGTCGYTFEFVDHFAHATLPRM